MEMLPELDAAKVGEALMRIAITSHFLGHRRITYTVDPYLLSSDEPCSPETQFVIDILHKDPAEVIPQEEVLAYMRLSSAWDPPAPRQMAGISAPERDSETRP
jgi:hypothetical protein